MDGGEQGGKLRSVFGRKGQLSPGSGWLLADHRPLKASLNCCNADVNRMKLHWALSLSLMSCNKPQILRAA
jgi:hypothetical protein